MKAAFLCSLLFVTAFGDACLYQRIETFVGESLISKLKIEHNYSPANREIEYVLGNSFSVTVTATEDVPINLQNIIVKFTESLEGSTLEIVRVVKFCVCEQNVSEKNGY